MSKFFGISYTVLSGDPFQTPEIVVNITPQGSGESITFRIQHQLPFTLPAGLPIRAQISDAEHDQLKTLISQPNKLFSRLLSIVIAENPAGFAEYITWFFGLAKAQIIREVLRELRGAPPPPPPPTPQCCG